MKFYSMMDCPGIPDHLIAKIRQQVEDPLQLKPKVFATAPGRKEYRGRLLTLADGTTVPSVTSQKWNMPAELEQWIRSNVYADPWIDAGINKHNLVSSVMGPHVDDIKKEIIMCVVDPGGDQVETIWWQQKGHPIERLDKLPEVTGGFYTNFDHYQDLTELDRVCLPTNKWVRMNTLILHSVENMTSPRTIVKIGL